MAGVNKVMIIGYLARDPELKQTNSGNQVCRMTVATTRVWKNKQTDEKVEETEWHRVTVWGKTAESCNKYLAKGRMAYVEGRLKTSKYQKEGQDHYSTEIIAETVQFLGGGKNSDNEGGGNSGGGNSNGGNSGGGGYDEDDDIPF